MAIPAGLIAKRFGYKGGILVGLSLIAAGAFWFIPATSIGTYWAFLLGLFVIAAGMTCLETIANPYTTVLGAPEGGPTRINIAKPNGAGWIPGPIVGGYFVFAGAEGANAGLSTLFGHCHTVALCSSFLHISPVPDLHAVDENRDWRPKEPTSPPALNWRLSPSFWPQFVEYCTSSSPRSWD
jgi:FHS family L-fucose permease-like MFS transporter